MQSVKPISPIIKVCITYKIEKVYRKSSIWITKPIVTHGGRPCRGSSVQHLYTWHFLENTTIFSLKTCYISSPFSKFIKFYSITTWALLTGRPGSQDPATDTTVGTSHF